MVDLRAVPMGAGEDGCKGPSLRSSLWSLFSMAAIMADELRFTVVLEEQAGAGAADLTVSKTQPSSSAAILDGLTVLRVSWYITGYLFLVLFVSHT